VKNAAADTVQLAPIFKFLHFFVDVVIIGETYYIKDGVCFVSI